MKKYLLSVTLIFLAAVVFAQDEHSSAYERGYLFGKGAAMLLLVVLLFGVYGDSLERRSNNQNHHIMNPFRVMITGLILLFPVLAFTQTSSDLASKIPGKWLLVKHILKEKGKTDDLLTSNEVYTYEFKSDNTYSSSFINKKNQTTTIISGKWKLINAATKLKLYDNTMTGDDHLVADKTFPIIRLTATEFVTKELLFGMDLLGTSYYKRQ